MSAVVPVQRVRDLVRLAVDPAASEAEARTAAFTACKLIAAHGILIGETAPAASTPRQTTRTAQAQRAGFRIIRARFTQTCITCGDRIQVGERCAWMKGVGVRHIHCDFGEDA